MALSPRLIRRARRFPPSAVGHTAAPTLTERAYAQLKERIISAAYPPGAFLQEATVCADIGIGRTPVRHALERLEQEGLVKIIHRKGVMVSTDSLREVVLAMEARLLVEPFCAAKCAERASRQDVDRLHKLQQRFEAHGLEGDRQGLLASDVEFHREIAIIADNRLLLGLLKPIQERMMRLWFLPQWQLEDYRRSASEHDAIVRAVGLGDGDAASTNMRAHLLSIQVRMSLLQPEST